ncbi:hypothetical protein RCC89_12555 [Cytophagaceae bacterium ABcell3]|nr:hypothetical protein RCC89_12555 [Cytophagaceae bacterium ABcell3]
MNDPINTEPVNNTEEQGYTLKSKVFEKLKSFYMADLKKEVSIIGFTFSRLYLFLLAPVFLLASADIILISLLVNAGFSVLGMIAMGIFGLTTAALCGFSLGMVLSINRIMNAVENILDLCLVFTIKTIRELEQKAIVWFGDHVKVSSTEILNQVSSDVQEEIKKTLKKKLGVLSYPLNQAIAKSMAHATVEINDSVGKAVHSYTTDTGGKYFSKYISISIEYIESYRGKLRIYLENSKKTLLKPFLMILGIYGSVSVVVFLLLIWLSA